MTAVVTEAQRRRVRIVAMNTVVKPGIPGQIDLLGDRFGECLLLTAAMVQSTDVLRRTEESTDEVDAGHLTYGFPNLPTSAEKTMTNGFVRS